MAYTIKGAGRATGIDMLTKLGYSETDFEAKKDSRGNLLLQDKEASADACCPEVFEERQVGNLWAAEWRTADGKFKLKSNNADDFARYVGIPQVFIKTISFWRNPEGELVWDEFYESWVSTGTGQYPKKTVTRTLAEVFTGSVKTVVTTPQGAMSAVRR